MENEEITPEQQDQATADAFYGNSETTPAPSEPKTVEPVDAPEATPETPSEPETAEEPTGAPEAYDFKFDEGVNIDGEVLTSFSEIAKEIDLPQDSAQKILDKIAPKFAERQAAEITNLHNSWAEQTRLDPELGGEKLEENLSFAKKTMDRYGNPELTAFLNESGLGNHPEMIRAFYNIGKKISEDTYVGNSNGMNGSGAKGPQTFDQMAETMYKN